MKHPRYAIVESGSPYSFVFISEGPKGKIRKGIFYTELSKDLFNLGFGDLDEDMLNLNDSSRSNNGDRDKVLATVAYTAVIFTDRFPEARIFARGSTIARTRLYQIGIAAHLPEISENFKIKGFKNGIWERFQRGRGYEAFLITRKRL